MKFSGTNSAWGSSYDNVISVRPATRSRRTAAIARAGDLAQNALVVMPARKPSDAASATASATMSACSIGSPPTKWTISIVGICATC